VYRQPDGMFSPITTSWKGERNQADACRQARHDGAVIALTHKAIWLS